MKKSLLALAVLGAFAGVASAQSTVTLFGIIDLNLRNVKNGSTSLKTLSQDGINSSRFGVRGVEDIGGGLRAGFWLEGALNPDTGNAVATTCTPLTAAQLASTVPVTPTCSTSGAQTWQRRSTVSLLGGFGELRLGRDYTPSFWNTTVFDPFGTNGVGNWLNIVNTTEGTTASTFVRANNSVGYFLPGNLGGLYGQAQISAPEGTPGNKYTGARLGYAGGPVNVAASFGSTKTTPSAYKHNNIAGSFKLGSANLMAQYNAVKAGAAKQTGYLLGVVLPMGPGEFKASIGKTDQSGGTAAGLGAAADASQFALGYVYNLSKRTAMYGTYSSISNKGTTVDGANFTVGAISGFTMVRGAKSTGYEVGLRHSF